MGVRQSICQQCGKVMKNDQLSAYQHIICKAWNFGHLNCFTPYQEFPLDFDEIEFSEELSGADIAKVTQRVQTWNRQFQVIVPEKYLRKAVKTKSPPARRVLTEAFVYLTPAEIEQVAAFACKAWFHVTRHEELWRRMYLTRFPPPADDRSYRKLAIAKRMESCWHCGKQLTLAQVARVCPVRGSWLCKGCFAGAECAIEKLTEYCDTWRISYKLVKALQVPTFRFKGAKGVYVSEIRDRILPYVLSRRQKILNFMQIHYEPEKYEWMLRFIEIAALEKQYSGAPIREMKPLFELLGLAEEGESLGRSVRSFLCKMAALSS